jgi:hypothetical protein
MFRILGIIALLSLAAGCAAPATTGLMKDSGGLPVRAQVAGVPFYPQSENQCGPAALAMTVSWGGIATTPDDLASIVMTPGKSGSLQSDLQAAARRIGMFSVPIMDLAGILREVAAGSPVIVFQNLALDISPQWHFAVVHGYDLARREIVLHSGLDPDMTLSLDRFEWTWTRGGRWALVVLPPGRLPASAGEMTLTNAAVALERVGRSEAAARSFAAILGHYPNNLVALIGLGNSRFAGGDTQGAEAAYRQAIQRHPDAAVAWNNLAYVRAETGNLQEALEMARRAVSLGGPNSETFQETLESIRARLGSG